MVKYFAGLVLILSILVERNLDKLIFIWPS